MLEITLHKTMTNILIKTPHPNIIQNPMGTYSTNRHLALLEETGETLKESYLSQQVRKMTYFVRSYLSMSTVMLSDCLGTYYMREDKSLLRLTSRSHQRMTPQ